MRSSQKISDVAGILIVIIVINLNEEIKFRRIIKLLKGCPVKGSRIAKCDGNPKGRKELERTNMHWASLKAHTLHMSIILAPLGGQLYLPWMRWGSGKLSALAKVTERRGQTREPTLCPLPACTTLWCPPGIQASCLLRPRFCSLYWVGAYPSIRMLTPGWEQGSPENGGVQSLSLASLLTE